MMNTKRKTAYSSAAAVRTDGQFDWWLVAIMLLLLCMGLLMVFSASGAVAERLNGDKYYFFKRQALYAALGAVAMLMCAHLPRNILYKLQYPLLITAAVLLVLTLTPLGLNVNGASRWISMGAFSIQPLELAKVALALYLAYFMSVKHELVRTFSKGVIPPFLVTIILCMLLLLQPDFGGAAVLVMILFFMCLVGGTRLFYLAASAGLAVLMGAVLIINEPYRFRRLLAFLDPFEDPLDTGYQLVQSLYALGSGSFFGVGMGGSAQKMLYLPESHNDFIMAVVGEELGFLGITVIMLLFALFFSRCYRIITAQDDLRDRLTSFSLTLVIAIGAVLNLAVVLGMAPPKGVAMPFMSYGGSSLLATLACVGLILNFSRSARSL